MPTPTMAVTEARTVAMETAYMEGKARGPRPAPGGHLPAPSIPAELAAAVPEDIQQAGPVEAGAADAEGMECAQSQAHRKGPSGMVLLQELLVQRIQAAEAVEAEADAAEVPDAVPMVPMAALGLFC